MTSRAAGAEANEYVIEVKRLKEEARRGASSWARETSSSELSGSILHP